MNRLPRLVIVLGAVSLLTDPSSEMAYPFFPPSLKGTAFGYYHMAIGLTALPASLFFGWLWYRLGPNWAFGFGGGPAVLGFVIKVHPESPLS